MKHGKWKDPQPLADKKEKDDIDGINDIESDIEDTTLYTERLYNHIRELEKRVEKCERDIDLMLLSDKKE